MTGFLFLATKLVLKWTYKKKFVVTYFLYVATNNKLRPKKIYRDKISICRDIIQLEQGQFLVATQIKKGTTLGQNLSRQVMKHNNSWPINRKV